MPSHGAHPPLGQGARRDPLAIEQDGYDTGRGVLLQSFGSKELDAAPLRLPSADLVAHDDPRMPRTTDAIREELDDGDGLILRHRSADGPKGREGAFVPCSFWLVECLAHQDRLREARELFDSACIRVRGRNDDQDQRGVVVRDGTIPPRNSEEEP